MPSNRCDKVLTICVKWTLPYQGDILGECEVWAREVVTRERWGQLLQEGRGMSVYAVWQVEDWELKVTRSRPVSKSMVTPEVFIGLRPYDTF